MLILLIMNCELCKFNNPRGTATAVVIQESKLLLLKRSSEPFKNAWDLPGGYMQQGETPETALTRELKEELGTDCELDFIGWFPGTAFLNGEQFAILSHTYLAELTGKIELDQQENSTYQWTDIDNIDPAKIAFDSNQDIVKFVKNKFAIDYSTLKELINQLDGSAEIREINFYRSLLNGYISKKIVEGKLIGVGWIFTRRTLLRKQAVIEDVVVDQNERGKGYGEEITRDLMRWAKENGVETIELTSGSHRVAANNLYKKLGFKLHPTNHYLYQVS